MQVIHCPFVNLWWLQLILVLWMMWLAYYIMVSTVLEEQILVCVLYKQCASQMQSAIGFLYISVSVDVERHSGGKLACSI